MSALDGIGNALVSQGDSLAAVLLGAASPVDTDPIDTLMGALMISLAIGVIAVILIAISRARDATVSVEQALVAPAVICSLGAAVLHLWETPDLLAAWPPAGVASFLLAAFQAEWAFAFSRSALRRVALAAGFVVNALAVFSWCWSHTLGPALGPTAGVRDALSGLDLAAVSFEVGLVLILGLALWPGTRDRLMTRHVAAVRAVELRSLAASAVGLLTFLALAGLGHGHA